MQLVGRENEIERLEGHATSSKSEFVALYGRRRVGKTFLIREAFRSRMTFQMTAVADVGKQYQLGQFHAALTKYFPGKADISPAQDWFTAFQQLSESIESVASEQKKIIFIDELPWLDTRGAKFLPALEHFWNNWASNRKDVLLIVCGSAASWMIKKLLNNKRGLYNRVTDQIKLEPFNLYEVEQFFKIKNAVYDRYQIILAYMAFGGIPYYLEKIKPEFSIVQNVNTLCFDKNAPFRSEYKNLYASLFNKSERHVAVIEALASKNKGLSRAEISSKSKLSNGGGLTRVLSELEESGFIRRYRSFEKKEKNSLYQLIDLYTLFYLNFISKQNSDDDNFWINALDTPAYRSWSGYAFEMVCLHHVVNIKRALGIQGIQTSTSTWRSNRAQIDLLIDRKDQVINLCEIKFSMYPFKIDKKYAENLRNKIGEFKSESRTKKAVFLTMITTYGLAQSAYKGMVQNDLAMDLLFVK